MDDKKNDGEMIVGPAYGDSNLCLAKEGEEVRLGQIRTLQDGESLRPGEDLVELKSMGDGIYGYQVLHRSGPSKVASPSYREGWDRVFGKEAN